MLFSGIKVTRALLSTIFWISSISNMAASTSGSAATCQRLAYNARADGRGLGKFFVDLLPRHFEKRTAGHDHAHLRILIALLLFIIQRVADGIRSGKSPGIRSARPKLVFTARSFWLTV